MDMKIADDSSTTTPQLMFCNVPDYMAEVLGLVLHDRLSDGFLSNILQQLSDSKQQCS